MLEFLSNTWKKWCESGIRLPYAFDPETNKPSITLMFYWITSFLSIISLMLLHTKVVEYKATGTALVFVLMAFIMYRLRKLDKVKIDVDDQSIELDNNGAEDAQKENDNETK